MAYIADVIRHLFAIVLLAVAGPAAAQQVASSSAKEQPPCDLAVFDQELRGALRAKDVARVALLVEYPLRVNDANGSIYIHDPASLQGHFEDIFTPDVRGAILGEDFKSDNCAAYTVIYGFGEAVVNLYERGYRIASINVSKTSTKPKDSGQVEFVCRTETSRMVLDSESGSGLRLRGWAKGRSLEEKPDIEIVSGKKEIEGTGACTHSVWTFQSGATHLSFSEIGCYPDSNRPPTGAIGQFSKDAGGSGESAWCF